MKTRLKKHIAFVLALLMVVATIPMTASAVDVFDLASVQDALDKNLGITLKADIEGNVTVPAGYAGILNLNGKTITGTVTNRGALTIQDNATGGVIHANGTNAAVYTLASSANATTTINSGTFTGDIVAGTETSAAKAEVQIKGGTFNGKLIASKNADTDEANIVVTKGIFHVDGGSIDAEKKVKVLFTKNDTSIETKTLGYAYTNTEIMLGDALPEDTVGLGYIFNGWNFTDAGGNVVDGTYKTVTEELLVKLQKNYVNQTLTATPSFTRGIAMVPPTNGTLTVDKITPNDKDVVTITAIPAAGYILGELKVTNGLQNITLTNIGNNKYTFSYTAGAAVTVEAVFARGIILANATNGKVAVDNLTPRDGQEVTITVTPNSGFVLSTLTVKNGNKEIPIADNGNKTYTFYFPEEASVTVTAVFARDTGIIITTTGSGTVTVDKTAPSAGEMITITAIPDTGYMLGQLTAKNGVTELAVTKQANDTYTFVYPVGGAVTVDALFTTGILITKAGNGTVTVDKPAPRAGETVTVTATPDTGYMLGQLTVKNGAADVAVKDEGSAQYSFTYSVGAVMTVDVLFTTGIIISKTANGSVKVDKPAPKAGETVTVTITPAMGYALKKLTVKNGATELTVKDNGNDIYTFTYPAGTGITVTIDTDFVPGVSVSKTENGMVKVDRTLPNADDAVTITVTPDKGYRLNALTVKNGAAVLTVKENTDGTYTFTYPAGGTVNVEAVFADRLPFTDVPTNQWYYEAVAFAYDNTLFEGTAKTTFSPGRNMTRAMMVQVLFNMTDGAKRGDVKFDDVENGLWYSDAISWAAANGVVDGVGNNRFAPMSDITREQMALMLYNYADVMGIELPETRPSGAFADAGSISGWAKKAVDAMYAAQVLNGKGENRFDPQGKATRAQVAEMFKNFMEAVKE